MSFDTGIIDTSVEGKASDPLPILDSETVITLDIIFKTGSHNKSRCTLEHSPDNVNWLPSGYSTNGTGSITITRATKYVRACVLKGEDVASTAMYFLTAK